MPMRSPRSGALDPVRRPRAGKPAPDKAARAFREQISSGESFCNHRGRNPRMQNTCAPRVLHRRESWNTGSGMGQGNDFYDKGHKVTRRKLLLAETFVILCALRG